MKSKSMTHNRSNPHPVKNTLATALITAALITIIAVMVLPIFGTAFTCDDDLFTASSRYSSRYGGHGGYFKASLAVARSQGRFYQLFAFSLAQLPYYFGSIDVANLFRVAGTSLAFVLFFFMLKEVLRNMNLAAFFTVLSAGLMQTAKAYNPFHGFALWFNLGIGCIFVSVWLFHRSIDRQSLRLRWASAMIFFASLLFYESFVPYSIYFFIMAAVLYREELRRSFKTWASAMARLLWPYAVVTAVYLVLYAAWRYAYPPSYTGHKMSLAGPYETISTIVIFSLNGLDLGSFLTFDFSWSGSALLAGATVLATTFIVLRKFHHSLPYRAIASLSLMAVLFIFIPNILFGFMPKYRQWVKADPFYLGSYYSAFPMAVLLGLFSMAVVKAASRYNQQVAAALLLSLIFANASYQTVQRAAPFYAQQHENRRMWDMAEGLIEAADKNGLSKASTIVAPYMNNMPYLHPGMYDYWSRYFSMRLGRKISVVDRFDGDAKPGEVLWLKWTW